MLRKLVFTLVLTVFCQLSMSENLFDDLVAELALESEAEAGDVSAQSALGVMYAKGEGASQDYKQAVKWFTKAAEQGDAKSQYNLGVMYDQGQGVPQDYKQAVKWFTKAAEQGVAEAQYNLGALSSNGKGVPQDYKQAYAWFSLAAVDGNKAAVAARNRTESKLTPAALEEAQKMAAELLRQIEKNQAAKAE